MDQFEKHLDEASPNLAYTVKHKLRDYNLMKSFMTSGSVSHGMEVNQIPTEDDAAPFPREEAVMTIYDRCPLPERHGVPDPSLGTPARYGRGCRNVGI
jgi:hypothetical protein